MKWIALTGFLVFCGVKVHVLGITGAGLLTLGQLGVTYGLDRLHGLREIKKDTHYITYDEYDRVKWIEKETTQ